MSSRTGVPAGRASCAEVLPPGVWFYELRGDEAERSYPLLPGEEPLVERAVDTRRRQFASARYCARQALAALGYRDVAILADDRGAPMWPEPVVGSMTHVTAYCAAAVTDDPAVYSLGLDAEHHRPLPDGVLLVTSTDRERRALDAHHSLDATVSWDTLLFSCKEAVYKAWYPLTKSWLGFEDVEVDLDAPRRRFTARLLGEPLVTKGGDSFRELVGRYAFDSDLVITAVAVPGNG